jgi:hypothetical protein
MGEEEGGGVKEYKHGGGWPLREQSWQQITGFKQSVPKCSYIQHCTSVMDIYIWT